MMVVMVMKVVMMVVFRRRIPTFFLLLQLYRARVQLHSAGWGALRGPRGDSVHDGCQAEERRCSGKGNAGEDIHHVRGKVKCR